MRISIQLSLAGLMLGLCAPGCKKTQDAATIPAEKSPVMNAPAATPGEKADSKIAASVDGVTLSREDLLQQVQSIMESERVPEAQMPMAMQFYAPRIVSMFVEKTLLLGEVKRLNISLDAAERKKYLQPYEEDAVRQGTTLAEQIKKAPMGEKKVMQELDDQFLIKKLADTLDAQIRGKIKIDEKALDTAFADATKERTEKRAMIDALHTQLLAGTNFEAVAQEHSEDPGSRKNGGALGKPFDRSRMVKPFADAAFSQKTGEIGPVVETEFGFHVIKVTAHNEAKPASGDTHAMPETVEASHILILAPPGTRDAIRKKMEDVQVNSDLGKYLADLRRKAKITTMFDKPAGMPDGMPGMPDMPGGMQMQEPE